MSLRPLNRDPLRSTRTAFVRVERTSDQSIPDATWTAISWTSPAEWDVGHFFVSGSATRLTAQVAGYYHVSGTCIVQASAAGTRLVLAIWKNGSAYEWASEIPGAGSANRRLCVGGDVFLTKGDYVEIKVFQNSGGALNVETGELPARGALHLIG